MRPIVLLAHLNEIDLVVDSIKGRLAEITDALKEPAALRSARAHLAAAEGGLAHLKSGQLDAELRQKQAADKRIQGEQRLYSGRVHNPKELQDIQAEVAQSRRLQNEVEDELLEIMIAIETAEQECAANRDTLNALAAEWKTAQASLRAEQARLVKQLAGEERRQAAARAAAPGQLLPLYDTMRSRRAGRAVATLDGSVCSACRVAVSPTKIEAARYGDELVYCENCGRLLWGE